MRAIETYKLSTRGYPSHTPPPKPLPVHAKAGRKRCVLYKEVLTDPGSNKASSGLLILFLHFRDPRQASQAKKYMKM